MKRLIFSLAVLVASYAVAQTCIVPRPPAPPTPTQLIVHLPSDGGTVGCSITVPGAGPGAQSVYAINNAKCAQAVAMAKQAAANDNGWNDGGAP